MDSWAPTQKTPERGRLRLGSRVVLWIFLAIAGFFLITEHAAHLFGILPYLLVLLCPLLHLLHGGHSGHREHGTTQHRPEGGRE
jgi:DUF2933 family protein